MDPRVIEQVEPFTEGLEKLRELVPSKWRYNGLGGTEFGTVGIGLLAADAVLSLPESVRRYHARIRRDDDAVSEVLVVNSDVVIWLLVNAVRELDRQVQELKGGK